MKSPFSRKVMNESFWVISSNLLGLLVTLLTINIITSKLNISQYGSLALILTIQGFFSLVFFGSINNGIFRFSSISIQVKRFETYFRVTLKIGILLGFLAIIVGFIISSVFFLFEYNNLIHPFSVVLATSILLGLGEFILSILLSLRKRKTIFLIKFIESIFKISLLLFLTINDYLDVLTIYLLVSLINYLLLLYYFKDKIKELSCSFTKFEYYWLNKILVYSYPFLLWGIFGWAQQGSLKWALEIFVSRDELGLFNALLQIGYSPVLILFGVLMNFLTPIIFEKINPSSISANSKIFLRKILIFSIFCVFLILAGTMVLIPISPFIVDMLFPIEYISISKYLPLVFLASGLYSTSNFLTNIPFSLNEPKTLLRSSIYSSVIGFVSAFLFIYLFGFIGGIYALLSHSIFYLFITTLKVRETYVKIL